MRAWPITAVWLPQRCQTKQWGLLEPPLPKHTPNPPAQAQIATYNAQDSLKIEESKVKSTQGFRVLSLSRNSRLNCSPEKVPPSLTIILGTRPLQKSIMVV